MNKSLISVIIPTYNRESTIKRSVESVLNQTYKNIEVFVIDDCSSDNTEKVIKEIKDERLKYIKLEKNSGACYARNYGINISNGEYVAFQDSDDEWLPNKLEMQLDNIKKCGSDIDFCLFNRYDNNKIELFPSKKVIKRINTFGIEKALRYGNFVSTQLLLIKRKCFNEILFDEKLPRLQDYDLILNFSSIYNISFTKICLVNVYLQSDSITKNPAKLIMAYEIMKDKEYTYKNILLSNLCSIIAEQSLDSNEKKKYYLQSLKYKKNFKTFIKYIINK